MPPSPRRRVRVTSWPRLVAFALTIPMFMAIAVLVIFDPGRAVAVDMPVEDELIGADALAELTIEITTDSGDTLEGAEVHVDDDDVSAQAQVSAEGVVWDASRLQDGEHEIVVKVPRSFPRRDLEERWEFTVDTTPPALDLVRPEPPLSPDQAVEITGRVDGVEDGAVVTAGGRELELTDNGFSVAFDSPPDEPLLMEVADAAGNVTSEEVVFPVVASRVTTDEIRSVHMSFWSWENPGLRDPILQMAEDGIITSVQLDLKDESGIVGYDSQVPLARESGAAQGIYDLEEAVRELHARDVHIIGRIVAFRDPIHSEHAWNVGERDQVIQTPDGEPFAGYGGFTNFAHPDVVDYQIDVAEEAVRAGVDDILWDYVRRPDGSLDGMVMPGLGERTPEQGVVDFVAEADRRLSPYGIGHGASVYGIAADRPEQIAQDIPAMSEHLDYVAPMVYPSHWGPGEYGVADPNRQPYDITAASVGLFVEQAREGRARVVPWLQDFSMGGVEYGPEEVAAQIRAAHDVGAPEWIMWDAGVTYTRDGLVLGEQQAAEASAAAAEGEGETEG